MSEKDFYTCYVLGLLARSANFDPRWGETYNAIRNYVREYGIRFDEKDLRVFLEYLREDTTESEKNLHLFEYASHLILNFLTKEFQDKEKGE